MNKESTKDKIIEAAATIINEKGFNNTGIQEILRAADVPKGSFYFYFRSKEDFGLELVDYYMHFLKEKLVKHLKSSERSHLNRLRNFFNAALEIQKEHQFRRGCPIGNLAQETGGLNQAFQAKLKITFNRMTTEIGRCLELAQKSGEIDASLDPYETADFILNSWEGALLRMKVERSIDPLIGFEKMIFGKVLK